MDKKSFFRGFGVGVIFSSLILGISFTVRTSDSYVSSKAKELGMVYAEEDNDLNLVQTKPSTSAEPDASEKPNEADKQTVEPAQTESANKTSTQAPGKTQEPSPAATKKVKATATPEKSMEQEKKKLEQDIRDEMKSLTIVAGDWSSDVSKKLESLGIIKDASDFDKYLNENGFSNGIRAGTYEVSTKDTYNELARKITGK